MKNFDASYQLPDKLSLAEHNRLEEWINKQAQALNESGVVQYTAERRRKQANTSPKATQDLAIQEEKARKQAERNRRYQAQVLAQQQSENKNQQAAQDKSHKERMERNRAILQALRG